MIITLLSPPYGDACLLTRTDFPLAMAYIASSLRANGHEVRYIDMMTCEVDETLRKVRDERPDVVGISCYTGTHRAVFHLVEQIKSIDASIKVVLGGHHATFFYEQILRKFPVDAIVLGEGEITVCELLSAWESDGDPGGVAGIAFRRGNDTVVTVPREPLNDLDELPLPDFDLFTALRDKQKRKNKELPVDPKKPYRIRISTSRGCPFNCIFCVAGNKQKVRLHSPKRVVDEVELLYETYGVGHFEFCDPSFTQKKDRIVEICGEILRRRLNVSWIVQARPDRIDTEVLRHMKKAGCSGIWIGAESGSPEMLKNLNKSFSVEKTEHAINSLREVGINTGMYIVIGSPGETDETIHQTIELVTRLKPDMLFVSPLVIYPGAQLYRMAVDAGFMEDDYWMTNSFAPINTMELNLQQLRKYLFTIRYQYLRSRHKYMQMPKLFVRRMRDVIADITGIRISRVYFQNLINPMYYQKIPARLDRSSLPSENDV